MSKKTLLSVVFVLPLVLVCSVLAQDPGRGAAPAAAGRGMAGGRGPAVVSPEVRPDRTVTLRILAPEAKSVTVSGEIMGTNPAAALTKDEAGIWSVTLGPLEPEIYSYGFSVDGMTVNDQRTSYVKPSSSYTSQVVVPGDGPQFYDARPVPHGDLRIVTYEAKTLGGMVRRMRVYTPPDYDSSHQEVSRPVPVPRRRRLGRRVDGCGPGQLDSGQPDCRRQGQADDRGDAVDLPAGGPWVRGPGAARGGRRDTGWRSGCRARGRSGCAGCCRTGRGGRRRPGRWLHQGTPRRHHAAHPEEIPDPDRSRQHRHRRPLDGRRPGAAHRASPPGHVPLCDWPQLRGRHGWRPRGRTGRCAPAGAAAAAPPRLPIRPPRIRR